MASRQQSWDVNSGLSVPSAWGSYILPQGPRGSPWEKWGFWLRDVSWRQIWLGDHWVCSSKGPERGEACKSGSSGPLQHGSTASFWPRGLPQPESSPVGSEDPEEESEGLEKRAWGLEISLGSDLAHELWVCEPGPQPLSAPDPPWVELPSHGVSAGLRDWRFSGPRESVLSGLETPT